MIQRWLDPIFRPFRELKSKWNGIKNVQANIAGDVKRVKAMAAKAKKDAADIAKKAKEASDKAKGYAGQAQSAAGQVQGAVGQAQGAYGAALGQAKAGQQAFGAGMQSMPGQQPGFGMGAPPPGGPPPMGGPPMGGGMGMGMGAPPPMGGGFTAMGGGYGQGMGMGGPAQTSNRTMAIMAGGTGAALAWLVPLKGPQRGQLLQLKMQSVIGKDPSCDVCINDAFLSSRHATIKVAGGVYVLEDHSTNGTYVNDRKITRHELVDSDFVKVGQTLMKFKAL